MLRTSLAIVAAVLAMSVGSHWAEGQLCGYPTEIPCPGCDEVLVTTGCNCGPVDQSCKCRNNSGQVQGAIQTMCDIGFFDYVYDASGPPVAQGDPIPCGVNHKCLTSADTPNDCGTYSSMGYCILPAPPGGGCYWKIFGTPWMQNSVVQGIPPCENPT